MFDFGELPIDFLKLRVAYGTSATSIWISIAATLALDTKDFKIGGTNIITNSSGSQLGNVGLKPELLAEVEFGLEANLFNNRLNAEISYYDRKPQI